MAKCSSELPLRQTTAREIQFQRLLFFAFAPELPPLNWRALSFLRAAFSAFDILDFAFTCECIHVQKVSNQYMQPECNRKMRRLKKAYTNTGSTTNIHMKTRHVSIRVCHTHDTSTIPSGFLATGSMNTHSVYSLLTCYLALRNFVLLLLKLGVLLRRVFV